MKKHVFSILAGCLTVSLWGGVPLAWTNSPAMPPRMLPPIPHGSAIEFAVTLSGYTTPPVADGADVRLWYQTNGMGRSWWSAPATLAGNVIRASFGAAQDTGADRVSLFFGAPSNVFASAVLRLTPSPGFAPNSQAVPASTLDFSQVEVANAPWLLPDATNAALQASRSYTDAAAAAKADTNKTVIIEAADFWTAPGGVVLPRIAGYAEWGPDGHNAAPSLVYQGGMFVYAPSAGEVYGPKYGDMGDTTIDFGGGVVLSRTLREAATNNYGVVYADGLAVSVSSATNALNSSLTSLVSRSSQSSTNYTDSATALTPVYSEWEIDVTYASPSAPDFYGLVWVPYDGHNDESFGWYVNTSNGRYSISGYDKQLPSATRFILSDFGDGFSASFTATRHIVGYTLGSHADKPLASTNAVAAAIDRSVAVAAMSATNYTDSTASTLYPKSSGETLATQVAAIGADLNAENAHFVSTNYDSVTTIPEAYVEIKMSNTWIRIWSEMTRWNRFVGDGFSWQAWQGWQAWSTNVDAQLSAKAAAEYAFYDGVTGEAAPDGYFWVGQPRVAIAAGMSYQRYVSSGAAVWVLESNGTVADVNGTTNGFFRITDDEGNSQFEIVKGSSRTVAAVPGAMSSSIVMGVTHWQTAYSVTNATSAPVAKFCRDLRSGEWYAEGDSSCPCNVSWSASGAGVYSCEWWPKSTEPQMFMKAEYGSGSETRIVQSAPVEMQHIVIGGVKYAIGTATISGSTVLTLSPATP